MSTKSTIHNEPCCHIYRDLDYSGGEEVELLCIEVSYGNVDYDGEECNYIQVAWDSDFAKMIRSKFAG